MIGPTVVVGATEPYHKHVLAGIPGNDIVRYGIGEHHLPWPPPGQEGEAKSAGTRPQFPAQQQSFISAIRYLVAAFQLQ